MKKINPRQLERSLAQGGPKGKLVYLRNLLISLVLFVGIFFALRHLRG
jgi:hypothetical protein